MSRCTFSRHSTTILNRAPSYLCLRHSDTMVTPIRFTRSFTNSSLVLCTYRAQCHRNTGVKNFDCSCHPTVGVHQTFLSPSRQELNISPDTYIYFLNVRATRPALLCASPKTNISIRVTFSSQLLVRHSLSPLSRSETFDPNRATPTVG